MPESAKGPPMLPCSGVVELVASSAARVYQTRVAPSPSGWTDYKATPTHERLQSQSISIVLSVTCSHVGLSGSSLGRSNMVPLCLLKRQRRRRPMFGSNCTDVWSGQHVLHLAAARIS